MCDLGLPKRFELLCVEGALVYVSCTYSSSGASASTLRVPCEESMLYCTARANGVCDGSKIPKKFCVLLTSIMGLKLSALVKLCQAEA